MTRSLPAARRAFKLAPRLYTLLRARAHKSWFPSPLLQFTPTTSSGSISSSPLLRDKSDYVSLGTSPDNAPPTENINHAQPETNRSGSPAANAKAHESFTTGLPGRYRKGRHGNLLVPVLVVSDGERSSYDDVLKRVTYLAEAFRSGSTEIHGLEVAEDVFVIKHKSSTGKAEALHEFSLEVELSRINKANALNRRSLRHLTNTFRAIATIEDVNSVLFTSARLTTGKYAFCSGADITEMIGLQSAEAASQFIGQISGLCTAIRDLPVPVVAAIDGPCFGAGLEVAASCDIRVATSSATFSMPEVLLGIPSVVEARLLCDIVGWGRARHLMLTGCTWSSTDAFQAGLITAQFDERSEMLKWTNAFVASCQGKSQVHRVQKALMREWEGSSVNDGIAAGVDSFASRFKDSSLRDKVRKLMPLRPKKAGDGNLKKYPTTKKLDLRARKSSGRSELAESDLRTSTLSSVESEEEQPQ